MVGPTNWPVELRHSLYVALSVVDVPIVASVPLIKLINQAIKPKSIVRLQSIQIGL